MKITKDMLGKLISELPDDSRKEPNLAENLIDLKKSLDFCIELLTYLDSEKLLNTHEALVYILLRAISIKTDGTKRIPDWIIEKIATNKTEHSIPKKSNTPLWQTFINRPERMPVEDREILDRIYNHISNKKLNGQYKAELIKYHIISSKQVSTRIKKELQTLPSNMTGTISVLLLEERAVNILLKEDRAFLKELLIKTPYNTLSTVLDSFMYYTNKAMKSPRVDFIYKALGRNRPDIITCNELADVVTQIDEISPRNMGMVRDTVVTSTRKFTAEQNLFELCIEASTLQKTDLNTRRLSTRVKDVIYKKVTDGLSTNESKFIDANSAVYKACAELFGKSAFIYLAQKIKTPANWILIAEQCKQNPGWKTENGYAFLISKLNEILLNCSTKDKDILNKYIDSDMINAVGLSSSAYHINVGLGMSKADALVETARVAELQIDDFELPDIEIEAY